MNKVDIFNLDAQEFMAKIPDEMVDVLITDPPYWRSSVPAVMTDEVEQIKKEKKNETR